MFCYLVDLLVEAWRFEIKTTPTNFLRRLIKFEKGMDSDRQGHFEAIFGKIKMHGIALDFEREEKLEEKRDLRTNKYTQPTEKKKDNGPKKIRAPRNEIELEFFTQEEWERDILDKYREDPYEKLLNKNKTQEEKDKAKKPIPHNPPSPGKKQPSQRSDFDERMTRKLREN